jgi:hypothetical protein
MFTLLRETPWVKEWQTPHGSFIDSKLRWLGIEPSAGAFLAAWRGASGAEKFDLEAAFQFYPYELEEDIEEILSTIAGMGPEDRVRAERMAERLFRGDSELSPDQQRFLAGLGEHLEQVGAPMRLVGENQWFAAYANDAGFHIDSRVSSPAELPTQGQLEAQIDASLSLAYRRILQTVKEHPELLRVEGRADGPPFSM